MSKNLNTTNQFDTDKAVAFKFLTEQGWKSERMLVALAMVNPETTDEEREDYTFTYTPGYVRRSFRQAARFLEKKGQDELAETFWALRDDIDPYTGAWFRLEPVAVAS